MWMDGGWVEDVGGGRFNEQARLPVGWRRELISGRSEEKLLLTAKTGNHSCWDTAHTHTHTQLLYITVTLSAQVLRPCSCVGPHPSWCVSLGVCLCVLIPVLVCCQSLWHCIVFCGALWSSNFGPGGDNRVLSGRGGRGRLCLCVCDGFSSVFPLVYRRKGACVDLIIALSSYQLFEKACIILCLASFLIITGNFKRQGLSFLLSDDQFHARIQVSDVLFWMSYAGLTVQVLE